jgi:hypothetical protein
LKRRGAAGFFSGGVVRILRNKRSVNSFVFALVLVAVLAGCGKRNPMQRLPIYGTVTLAGGEKTNGSITFLPAQGRSGPAATTSIVEGKYQFDAESGPTAGTTRVIVTRTLPKGALTLEMVKDKMTKETAAADKVAKAKSPAEKATLQKAADEEAAKYAKQFRTEWTFPDDVSADKSYAHDFTLDQ